MVSKSKLKLFWCLDPFFSEASHGPKTTLKKSGRVPAFHFNPYLKIKVSKIIGLQFLQWMANVCLGANYYYGEQEVANCQTSRNTYYSLLILFKR